MKNGLYVIATPIGNLADISARAAEILTQADIIACEDTRVTRKLFTLLNLNAAKPFITYQDHNEDQQAQKLIDMVKDGKTIALVSDAGSPLISDPGYKLIRRCREQGVKVWTVPGCCAVIAALQLSGLPTNRFMFAGFIPNKDKGRSDLFNELKSINSTLVFYETAPRIIKSLTAAGDSFGNREMAVAREITKIYEECINGTAAELIAHFQTNEPKGEMVLMIAPPTENDKEAIDIEGLLREKLKHLPLKTAVKELVETYQLNKNEVYALALKVKDES